MAAGRLACITKAEDLGDVRQSQTRALGCANKAQAVNCCGVVCPVTVRCAVRFWQQVLTFVEADGLTVHARGGGNFPDEHDQILRLDLVGEYKVYREHMDITLQYFDGCPNWMLADERLQLLVKERPDIVLAYQTIDTVEAAERAGFPGSPTILIDGVDAFGDASAPAALACRMYMTDHGPAGAPSLAQLRDVLS